MSPQAEAALDAVAKLSARKPRRGSKSSPRLTMEAIVNESGVPRATLYRLFGTKEALLEEASRRRGAEVPEEDTRQRVLDGLGDLISHVPLHKITLDRVAEHVGVGVVTIHRHFGGRDGLFTAFLSGVSQAEQAEAILADVEAPVDEVLERFITHALAFVHRHRGLLFTLMMASPEEAAWMHSLRQANGSTRRLLTAYFADQVERGRLVDVSPLLHTATLISLTMGAGAINFGLDGSTPSPARPAQFPPEMEAAFVRHIVNTFLHGAGTGRRRRQPLPPLPTPSRSR